MSIDKEVYMIEDLIEEYGKNKAEAYLSKVKLYYKEKGVPLMSPVAMARTWLKRDGHTKGDKPGGKKAYEFETMSRRYISSMLFAMGRMEHDEMKKLPGALFRQMARIEGETVIIDWDVPGITHEQIARIEHCLGMKLIIQGISVEEELPF